jgi:hypothetical protein
MQPGPLSDELSRTCRTNFAFHDLTFERDNRILAAVFSVKVRRSMIIEIHPNDDTEEHRDDRHDRIVAVQARRPVVLRNRSTDRKIPQSWTLRSDAHLKAAKFRQTRLCVLRCAAGGSCMSRVNGEKARAAVAKRNRTARRAKDRARLAEIRAANAKTPPDSSESTANK